ncbi:uncharacterized protein LOC129347780 isoform X2 [Amphiprion ocellaris]|uniref:uncharacterized protein LOC129347780 isoform X2 n=1 Tax=Amphiprion ocellaris TaxID=80972 RepID=UPI002410E115|nr:uncharacterized protein LOC129347780 isoform X2 [Amphiprion ocellaris]
MDENLTSGNMTFRRQNLLKWPHSPLAACSKLVACDQDASFDNSGMFSDSFINFRIEVVNNFTCKRKCDHSNPSYGLETPIKKPLNQRNFSSDLERVMDYCRPLTQWKQISPLTDSVQDCLDTTWHSSSSTTLLHHEQNFELVGQYTTSNKQQERPLQRKYLQEDGKRVKNQRVDFLNRDVDWKHRKNLYVRSVTQDMTESPGANHDVMSELLNLMSHVAKQTTGSSGTQWQHPSDLTRRHDEQHQSGVTLSLFLSEIT